MTAYAYERRGRIGARVFIATAVLAAASFAVVNRDANANRAERISGVVFPQLAERASETARLRITSSEQQLTIERDGETWTVAERGGYPADAASVVALMEGLVNLEFVERKTAEPGRHHRLGLDDPSADGDGVRIEAFAENGAGLAALIVGNARRTGGQYVRYPDEAQTFVAVGELPELDSVDDVIDLELFSVPRDAVAEIIVTPEEGPAYRIVRDQGPSGRYELAEPSQGWELLNQSSGSTMAGALSRLRFNDVRASSELDGAPVGSHVSVSADGFVVTLNIFAEGEERWAVIETNARAPVEPPADAAPDGEEAVSSAIPEERSPDQAVVERAAAIAAVSEGWAYLLPEFAAERILRPLDEVAQPEGEEPVGVELPPIDE